MLKIGERVRICNIVSTMWGRYGKVVRDHGDGTYGVLVKGDSREIPFHGNELNKE